jgi:hypothetical protein
MKLKSADITVVFQGAVAAHASESGPTLLECVRHTRRALPNARYVLSTWEGSELPRGLPVDEVVYSKDPGALPSIKFRVQQPNNINRQITSTSAGLATVRTTYAVKLRSDTFLRHAGFLDYYLKYARYVHADAMVFNKFFTVDPYVFEQMAFHLSDWFQFGPTEAMRQYWDARPMSVEDATHYQGTPHARHSTFLDREFRCRLAVEQHVSTQYASRLGYTVPRFHNDLSPPVLQSFRRFMLERAIVLDPWLIGLEVPKYDWTAHSLFQSMNCIGHVDWYWAMSAKHGSAFTDKGILAQGKMRAAKKRRLGLLARVSAPFGALLYTRPAKVLVNRVLKYL